MGGLDTTLTYIDCMYIYNTVGALQINDDPLKVHASLFLFLFFSFLVFYGCFTLDSSTKMKSRLMLDCIIPPSTLTRALGLVLLWNSKFIIEYSDIHPYPVLFSTLFFQLRNRHFLELHSRSRGRNKIH